MINDRLNNDKLTKEEVKISKFVSMVLRHRPEYIGLKLSKDGWANVYELIEKIKSKGKNIDKDILERVVLYNDKKRFSFNENHTLIRANQGHSIDVDLEFEEKEPPDILFHGTSVNNIDSIKKYGIKACSFNKFVPILTAKLNNRDHRKITIIDGNVGFTGGINLADEYINEKERFGHWKDNGVIIKGDAVFSLTNIFLNLWDYINNEKEDLNNFKPDIKVKNNGFVQPYDDSPFDDELVSETICINMINKAKKYVYITTPYLIIDNELETALCIAAKSGVDVRIITPGIPDKKMVNEVTKAYYNNLLNSGVKIYEYTKGFIHAKTFLVDDEIATIGTVNLDYRSLHLHFECGVLLYQTDSIKDIKKDISETLEISKQITLKDTKIGLFRSLQRAVLRLFAPLM